MKIGALAKSTGTPVETIRFYEREGILPVTRRSESNYRIYGASHEERLAFIRRCRSLDMALEEIRTLLRFKDAPEENCEQVNALLDDHIGHVAERIGELKDLARQLKALREQCQEVQGAVECGILKELSVPGRPVKERRSKPHMHGTHR